MSLEEDPALSQTPEAKGTGSRRGLAPVAWLSVGAAAAVMVGLIFVGYRQLDALRREIEAKQTQLDDLQSRYDALETSYRELDTSFNQLKYLVSVLPGQPEPGKGAIPGTSAARGPASSAPADPIKAPRFLNAPSKSTARIVIHIANESQRREAEAVADRLRAAGYAVPETRIVPVGSLAPKLTQLRYFQRTDEQGPDLAGITKTLQQAKIEAHPKYVPPGSRSGTAPGKFELWLGTAE